MSARAEANLAGDFPPATEEQWLAAVDSVLKGKPFESLVSTTADGISVPPLYVRESSPGARDEAGFPGAAPFTRGSFPHSRANGAWDVRGVVTPGDAGDANRRLLDDLGRGVTSVVVDRPDPATLGAVLDGVYLDLAPIVLRAGDDFVAASRALEAVWAERGVHPSDALGGFGADPLASILGGHGSSDLASRLAELGTLAARTAETYPKVRAVSVSTLAYVDAGASEAQELAAMLSTGVAYLRAMSDAGMSIDDACRQIEITVGVDADVFTSIAKLRAARRVWGAMAAACGASPSAQAPSIYAHTARRMLTRRDPWVNLLRVTAATFAAGVGGADGLTTHEFDALSDQPGELGHRMARNTQLLLQEESNIGRVLDPAGGSGYVESLTDELATVAWSKFGDFEAAGGFPDAVIDGTVGAAIAEVRSQRMRQVATRQRPITGVSEFPNLFEEPVGRSGEGSGAAPGPEDAGIVRWAEDFEALRDAADAYRTAHGSYPKVFLVNLGPVAAHTARATYAKNFFEVGGIEAVTSERGTFGFATPTDAVEDLTASGAAIACICSSDAVYAESAAEFAKALTAAGVTRLYLAGNPGDRREAETAAGVHEFIGVGADVLDVLRRAHDALGLDRTKTEDVR